MNHPFRIGYLDGIRGLAALAVTLVHAWESFGLYQAKLQGIELTGFDRVAQLMGDYIFVWGILAVEVFIVLSGYSLMLGVARSQDGKPKGGLKGYFLRRIQRIWPPYYMALAISLFMIVFVAGMNVPRFRYWDSALPALRPDIIASHLLFIQNWSGEWFSRINPPMWTVAVEEQIYILFPLLLLPFWRRLGTLSMVMIGIIVGAGLVIINPAAFAVTHSWYLALFALGAAAASINFSSRPLEMKLREQVPWFGVGVGLLASWVIIKVTSQLGFIGIFDDSRQWFEDIWLGAGIASMLIHWTEFSRKGQPLPRFSPLRLFTARRVITLGVFTYSLYLMHAPILAFMTVIADGIGLTGAAAYAFIMVVGVPTAVAGSFVFHLLFERPFMPQYAAQGAPTAAVLRFIDKIRHYFRPPSVARQTS
jgi:peptidoglycan/LPS O-acetylase OafA/YrhL